MIENGRVSSQILSSARHWDTLRTIILSNPLEKLAAACDVTLPDVQKLFRYYSDPGPIATMVGAGVQRYRYGGENVRFINALALISGNIGRSGGGSYFHQHSLKNLNVDWIKESEGQRRRALRMPIIGQELLHAQEPPVKMIWINGSNIVNQGPDSRHIAKALEHVEFKVVVDAFMTDTAERADMVLPSTLMLEQEDIIGSYLHDYIHYVRPVVQAPGECRSDFWILSQLGDLLNPPVILPDVNTCLEQSLKTPYVDISVEELRQRNFISAKRPRIAYAGMRFDHGDGKYRFPVQLHEASPPPSEFPFRLLTLIRRNAMHSQILPQDQQTPPQVWISPDNPGLASLNTSKNVYLVSPLGRLRVVLDILPGLHPEVVVYRRGDWMKCGGGANQLIAAQLTDMGSGAPFYEQYVRLESS
jgi:anaerobic selenocysteine-containing dehydrogenase